MSKMMNGCHLAVEASKLQLLRIQRVLDASQAQIVAAAGLIQDSANLLAATRFHGAPHNEPHATATSDTRRVRSSRR